MSGSAEITVVKSMEKYKAKTIGIRDVAEKSGVSISTVSNVLNNRRYVSPEMALRVRAAAEELGYVPNPVAKNMKNAKSNIIGVITNDMFGVFTQYIVKGISEVAAQRGYTIIVSSAKAQGKVEGDREIEVLQQYINSNVDAVILSSTVRDTLIEKHSKQIIELANRFKYTPVVSLERDFSAFGIDSVFFDGYTNAKNAVQHLIDSGCKYVCHISGPENTQMAKERIDGYKAALQENGIAFHPRMMVSGNYSHKSGYLAMKQLLDNNPPIDGVFCANDQMGVGALKTLKEYGLTAPNDIKVIGYDDIFVSSIMEPSLSTIHIRKHRAGTEAARIAIDRIENSRPDLPIQKILLEGRLVVRKSTVATAADDWILTDW